MRTYTNNLMAANGLIGTAGYAPARVGKGYTVTGINTTAHARNIALFFAAPFIGLAYLLAFPLVGFALLAWVAAKAVINNDKARPVALALAAPFIGLAFVTVGPIAGLVALAWFGGKALLKA